RLPLHLSHSAPKHPLTHACKFLLANFLAIFADRCLLRGANQGHLGTEANTLLNVSAKPSTLWTLVKQSRLDPRAPYSFTLDIITRIVTVRSRSLESRRLDLVPDGFSNQKKARYNRSLMP